MIMKIRTFDLLYINSSDCYVTSPPIPVSQLLFMKDRILVSLKREVPLSFK
jgi:hypothetical protein